MRRSVGVHGIGLGLCVLASTAHAGASPRMMIETAGACPDPRALRSTTQKWIDVVETDGEDVWTMRTEQTDGGARLELVDPKGEVTLEREIRSRDCASLAKAFSFIAQANFVRLGLVSWDRPVMEGGARSVEPSEAPAPDVAVAHPWTPWVGLAFGADASIPGGEVAGTGRLMLGVVSTSGWGGRLMLGTATPVVRDGVAGGVRRWASEAAAQVGVMWGQELWLRPEVGAGVVVSRVETRDGLTEKHRIVYPIVRADLEAGIRFGGGVHAFLGLDARLFPKRERYLLGSPCEEAFGPRLVMGVQGGVQVDF